MQIPAVDWIIQFDPPDDPRDYIHRVGRTARGANGKGRSLMFLQPSEVGFLKHLKEARVPVVEFEFPAKRIVNVQSQLEKLIGQNYYLNKVHPSTSPQAFLSFGFFPFTVLMSSDCLPHPFLPHSPKPRNSRSNNPQNFHANPSVICAPITVRKRGLPILPPSLRLPLSPLRLRRAQT